MQTIQIDKLGVGVFDGTTLVTPGVTAGVTITRDPAESQILIEIADGVPAGQFDLLEIVNIAPTNSLAMVGGSIGGDFLGLWTGGTFGIVSPPDPATNTRDTATIAILSAFGGTGILAGIFNIPRWFPVQHLFSILTVPGDPGPYRVILLVEERPTLPLEAAFAGA